MYCTTKTSGNEIPQWRAWDWGGGGDGLILLVRLWREIYFIVVGLPVHVTLPGQKEKGERGTPPERDLSRRKTTAKVGSYGYERSHVIPPH